MSILGLYSHQWYDAPEWSDEDAPQDVPVWPAEALTVAAGAGWWSAALDTDDDDLDA